MYPIEPELIFPNGVLVHYRIDGTNAFNSDEFRAGFVGLWLSQVSAKATCERLALS